MTKQYLLTIFNKGENKPDFFWFDTEEELKSYININRDNIIIYDALKIKNSKNIYYAGY